MVHMFRAPHLETVCPNCFTEHKGNGGWKPKFAKDFHYRTCSCPKCDYEISVPTERMNSGHY